MHVLAGTSGYSYKEWKGSFYPDDLSQKDMLAYYGTKLPAVEINNTFYRLPKASVLESWAEQVPADFRFSIKASRRITHLKRLKDAESETTYLFNTLESLGPRLGVVLMQLPPAMKKDLDRLAAFLDLLPAEVRVAFEFRHATWFDDEVFECLRQHDRALCVADVDDEPEPEIVSTAGWGYLRLRRTEYSDDSLRSWLDRMGAHDWTIAYAFFKHEEDMTGPQQATRTMELA